jgi:hypothetical protein
MACLALFATAAAPFAAVACGSRTGLEPDGAARGPSGPDASVSPDASTRPDASGRPLDCTNKGITYIYAIGEDNQIYSYYPKTGEFTFIGTLNCPAPPGATPFSMAVDHEGTAYVVFSHTLGEGGTVVALPGNGELFKVSTKTALCESTPFVPNQHGFFTFGMAFVANVGDGGTGETLYVAGDTTDALATINLDTFELDVVAPFTGDTGNPVAQAELTGTGDGRLFGFFAPANMNNVPPSFIDQIDPRSAKVLSSVLLPDVIEGQGWAFGFWGGDFYTFTAPDDNTTVVTRYKPSDGSVTQVATAPSGVVIVGAGVSTCAPQE